MPHTFVQKFAMRFYAVILLGIMALNIGKYQLPYIQYNLFEDYIAENLCVNRYDKGNCCRGKCFLEKQIGLADETDSDSGKPEAKKQIKGFDDCVIKEVFLQKPNPEARGVIPLLTDTHLPTISLDIPIPP
ncbi:MAG: hypothetical protein LBB73_08390, partial [Dysgonamonadaceae bacterium]|nr:hypothetical protein [Dysgonamonadaceae bacterium]